MTKKLVGAHEIAELLDVTTQRVYDLARQNIIPHVRLGRVVKFDLERVQQWIDAGGTPLPGGWRREA
ncbi:helix-turn-helix domain-containing protein [Alicyclobacillus fastidiosus]|uniref:Helix-turn-helix domain-containing protein n=1 Tax=Alicyclobacillus fastidiosus TaxID=392011 RepID=A0ABY6ZPQ4_9BACL|nr:helix-turn-helix domain-containing protein [Alicyclobacillus fastidiosus]WAH44066.1 helix-turn-helix domain-containing protein [Alicyclobacillus fastidiosus]GMA60353.1 hypothetical protein GCM10025859_07930 [Alicyclobacillus fastidiosus]